MLRIKTQPLAHAQLPLATTDFISRASQIPPAVSFGLQLRLRPCDSSTGSCDRKLHRVRCRGCGLNVLASTSAKDSSTKDKQIRWLFGRLITSLERDKTFNEPAETSRRSLGARASVKCARAVRMTPPGQVSSAGPADFAGRKMRGLDPLAQALC